MSVGTARRLTIVYQDIRIFPKQISKDIVSSVCLSLATPLDGVWSQWGPWTQCSQTCGISGGTVLRRTRLCNQPPPMNGGQSCPGNDTETARACFTPCPGKFALRLILFAMNQNSLNKYIRFNFAKQTTNRDKNLYFTPELKLTSHNVINLTKMIGLLTTRNNW